MGSTPHRATAPGWAVSLGEQSGREVTLVNPVQNVTFEGMAPRDLARIRDPDLSLYGGQDPRELPRYTYRDAARATEVPASTIAAWVRGMAYTRPSRARSRGGYVQPVIRRPDAKDARLSFNNLIEINVLRALREVHEVKLATVREAIEQAQKQHGIRRLLISEQLAASGGELFLDRYFTLEDLSHSAQFAMRDLLKQYLARVHMKEPRVEFSPIPRTPAYRDQELISVSPFIAFGRPRILRLGVSTSAIADRVNVGEEKSVIMEDYGLNEMEFAEAVLYEAAA